MKLEATVVTLALSTRPQEASIARQLIERSVTLEDDTALLISTMIIYILATLMVLDRLIVNLYQFLFVGWADDLWLIGQAVLWRAPCFGVG